MLVKPKTYGKWGAGNKAIVVFRHDDHGLSWYDIALPIYEKNGITGTFHVITNNILTRDTQNQTRPYYNQIISVEKLQEMDRLGHEIASHTHNHIELTTISDAEIRTQVETANYYLNQWGFSRIETFAAPFTSTTDHINNILDDYYTCNGTMGTATSIPPPNYYTLPAFIIEKTTTVQQVKDVINNCISGKKFVQLMFHTFDKAEWGLDINNRLQYSWLDTQLEELCAWCATLNKSQIIFPPQRDATRYMKGLGDYNYTVTSLNVTTPPDNIRQGLNYQLQCVATNSNNEAIYSPSVATFQSKNTSIATVDKTGLITAKAAGYTSITVTADDITKEVIIKVGLIKEAKSNFLFNFYLNQLQINYPLTAFIYSNSACTLQDGYGSLSPGQTYTFDRWLKNESEIPINVTLSTTDTSITLSPDGSAYSNSVAFLLQPNEVKNFKVRIVAGTQNKTFTITKTIRG